MVAGCGLEVVKPMMVTVSCIVTEPLSGLLGYLGGFTLGKSLKVITYFTVATTPLA